MLFTDFYCASSPYVTNFMFHKSKIGFGYIVGKLIICSVRNRWNYFSKEVKKVVIRR